MEPHPFGNTGLTVSRVGFGAGHIGRDWQQQSDADAVLDAVLDAGITFLDTARGYEASEARVGDWLARRRPEVVVSTKVGYDVEGHADWSAGAIRIGVEEALRCLGVDVLDVVFLHSCSLEELQRGEAVEALLTCRDKGLVRVPGYSGENAELAWAVTSGVFGAVQTSVNLVDQHSRREVLPEAARRGIGVVAKRPLANAPWRHRQRPTGEYGETYWERLRTLGLQPAVDDWVGTALRFSAFSPGVGTAIVGSSSPTNIAAVAAAAELGPLPAAEVGRWEAAFAPHEAEWPGEV